MFVELLIPICVVPATFSPLYKGVEGIKPCIYIAKRYEEG